MFSIRAWIGRWNIVRNCLAVCFILPTLTQLDLFLHCLFNRYYFDGPRRLSIGGHFDKHVKFPKQISGFLFLGEVDSSQAVV